MLSNPLLVGGATCSPFGNNFALFLDVSLLNILCYSGNLHFSVVPSTIHIMEAVRKVHIILTQLYRSLVHTLLKTDCIPGKHNYDVWSKSLFLDKRKK